MKISILLSAQTVENKGSMVNGDQRQHYWMS